MKKYNSPSPNHHYDHKLSTSENIDWTITITNQLKLIQIKLLANICKGEARVRAITNQSLEWLRFYSVGRKNKLKLIRGERRCKILRACIDFEIVFGSTEMERLKQMETAISFFIHAGSNFTVRRTSAFRQDLGEASCQTISSTPRSTSLLVTRHCYLLFNQLAWFRS